MNTARYHDIDTYRKVNDVHPKLTFHGKQFIPFAVLPAASISLSFLLSAPLLALYYLLIIIIVSIEQYLIKFQQTEKCLNARVSRSIRRIYVRVGTYIQQDKSRILFTALFVSVSGGCLFCISS